MTGCLAENIRHFAGILRKAGLSIGPAVLLEALEAVAEVGVRHQQDFYWALHGVFVKYHHDRAVFHAAFMLYFKPQADFEMSLRQFDSGGNDGTRQVLIALQSEQENAGENNTIARGQDAGLLMSSHHELRHKDFAQMTADEVESAKRAIKTLILPVEKKRTRRYEATQHSERFDPRKTMRQSFKSGGELMVPRFRQARRESRKIVALCDISGSMSLYTRLFLHFLHAMGHDNRRVETFLFGTRLTNVTRCLRCRDVDEALQTCSRAVDDWSGGTRIGFAVQEFNKHWSRRMLGQGGVVLIITDGLEREGVTKLAEQMGRLQRSCKYLIWLNPLLRYHGFQPQAAGIRAMLGHVDALCAIHSLDNMEGLCTLLSNPLKTR